MTGPEARQCRASPVQNPKDTQTSPDCSSHSTSTVSTVRVTDGRTPGSDYRRAGGRRCDSVSASVWPARQACRPLSMFHVCIVFSVPASVRRRRDKPCSPARARPLSEMHWELLQRRDAVLDWMYLELNKKIILLMSVFKLFFLDSYTSNSFLIISVT